MFLINTEEKVDIVTPTRESMRKRWSTTPQVRRLSQFCQQAGNKPLKLNALLLFDSFLYVSVRLWKLFFEGHEFTEG